MEITVNGAARSVPDAATLAEVLNGLGLPSPERGMAVSLNGEVVRRAEWAQCRIRAGDQVEVVQATQGG